MAYLARLYGVPAHSIAMTVRSWLAALPSVPPPSRQRSAPPIVGLSRMAPSVPSPSYSGQHRPPEIMKVAQPPPSAPVLGNDKNVVAAMKALDMRLNRRVSTRLPLASQSQQLNCHLGPFQPVALPGRVPEDAPAHHGDDSDHLVKSLARKYNSSSGADEKALAAYLERAALVHGRTSKLNAPTDAAAARKDACAPWWNR